MGSAGVLQSQRRRGRRTPPSSSFAIDWSHPIAAGLTFLWLPGLSPLPQHGLVGSEPTYGTHNAAGLGTRWGASSDKDRWFAVPVNSPLYALTWPGTIAKVANNISFSGTGQWGLIANRSASAPYNGFCFVVNSTYHYAAFPSGTSLNTQIMGTSNADSLTRWYGQHVWVATAATGDQRCYVDGIRVNSSTTTLASGPTMTAPTVTTFGDGNSAPASTSSSTMMAFWSRVLSASEVAEFSADPFCFLRY